jgi:hypothetical protein
MTDDAPMDMQGQMNRGARNLRRMVGEAIAEADARCASGDAQGGKDAWQMVALLAAALAHGRGMNIGGVAPAFGSK